MGNDKRGMDKPAPLLGQLSSEVKILKQNYDQLRITVGKLKDILQVQDNWHSRVSRWIGSQIELAVDHECNKTPLTCKLLWTDRYNIGVEVDGKERLYNKGHVVHISLA
jgi:hypothetical protein